MTSLVESLREQYPCEQTPFGRCVIVPSRSFKPEWEQQLRSEGVKVFSQSWNGELSFFVRLLEKPASRSRKSWSQSEVDQLKQLLSLGLTHREIASKLDRSRASVTWKIQRLGLNRTSVQPASLRSDQPSISEQPNRASMGDDVVKEFLSACSVLYPSHKTACAYLLREASNKILGEQKP